MQGHKYSNTPAQDICILSWNACSLPAHGAELKHHIIEIDAKPQIICIQETWFKDTSTFKILKCRKNRQGGGVATFIQVGMPYERIQNIPNEIEGITIKIKLIETDLTITNLYNSKQKAI